jgi:hypothetical protein
MANQLRPGGMGAVNPDGPEPPEFQDSLADSIEKALNALLHADGFERLPVNNNTEETRHRRRLLVAIAQGVVRHLVDNAAAFRIVDAANHPTGERIHIQADPTLL